MRSIQKSDTGCPKSYKIGKSDKVTGWYEYCHRAKTNPDPLYGGGFRWYLNIEEQYGPDAVVKIMRTWLHQDGTKRDS